MRIRCSPMQLGAVFLALLCIPAQLQHAPEAASLSGSIAPGHDDAGCLKGVVEDSERVEVPESPEEEKARDQWIRDAPHKPTDTLEAAVRKAAWPSQHSKGTVMVTTGSRFAFDHLLPRWLDSMSRTRDGDLTQHAVVIALGQSALDFCLREGYRQHCVLDEAWPGPDRQYNFGDDWYVAVTFNKVEVISNILSLGYSLFWVDTDIVHFGNALPYLESLDVEMAFGAERCDVVSNFSSGYTGGYEQNTGTIYLRAMHSTIRFVSSWMGFQKQHLLEWGPADFDKTDGNQRRSDQVTLNKFALPHLATAHGPAGPYVRAAALSYQHFPNFCGGPCGCEGPIRREATSFIQFQNSNGHLVTGRVNCPPGVVADWFTYHVPCTWSTGHKAGLLDTYQHLSDRLQIPVRSTRHHRQ